MKIIIILFVILGISSCKKDSVFDDFGFYGEGTALVNKVEWKGKTGIFPKNNPLFNNCLPDTCFSLLIINENKYDGTTNNILIDRFFLKVGKFQFNKQRYDPIAQMYIDTTFSFSYGTSIAGGEIVTGLYRLVKTDINNYFEIKEFNKFTGDIKGSFKARVVRDLFSTASGAIPDSLDIENGSFYGKINWHK